MKGRLFFILACCLPLWVFAEGDPPGKSPEVRRVHCPPACIQGVEDFVFIFPDAVRNRCERSSAFEKSIVSFYQWYLQNEYKVQAGLSATDKGKDLLPPFKITWQSLQEYFEIIKRKYPDLISRQVSAKTDSTGPVTESEVKSTSVALPSPTVKMPAPSEVPEGVPHFIAK